MSGEESVLGGFPAAPEGGFEGEGRGVEQFGGRVGGVLGGDVARVYLGEGEFAGCRGRGRGRGRGCGHVGGVVGGVCGGGDCVDGVHGCSDWFGIRAGDSEDVFVVVGFGRVGMLRWKWGD